MNFYINQNISIHFFKIGSVSNSSVLQIGSAGMIKSLSNNYNTGGFLESAPEASATSGPISGPVVPLQPPTS
ncbi:spore germination protein GerPB [Bacillus sp. PS06]|uniref:spore germination protein GerPB n=1 Tax=Bacillus sp. PS06 TaxID=2764176 RepID=UPI001782BECC|nr:spore germination protein GerPB [Bacillus sp. PS06]MBD8067592.1 spore gernimation protein GerPB [Bacillus sp. PS06]